MKIMNPIKRWKLKRDWRLVDTLEATYNWTDTKRTDTVYYYLKENGLGQRRCAFKGTGALADRPGWGRTRMESHPYYLNKIVPWLEGCFDPEIPTYESIKRKEFLDELNGKKT